jgi:hypothetical protein
VTEDTFLIPSCCTVFPSIDQVASVIGSPTQTGKEENINFQRLPQETQAQFTQLSHALRDFCAAAKLNAEIYSLGSNSHFIAETMQLLIGDYPYETSSKASVFLLDRVSDCMNY